MLPHPSHIPALPCCPPAMTRVAGSLAKSGEVLKLVNNLMKVPQLQRTMMEMSRGEWAGACWVAVHEWRRRLAQAPASSELEAAFACLPGHSPH